MPGLLWRRYRKFTGFKARFFRSICIFVILVVVIGIVGGVFDSDHAVPMRGNNTRGLNTCLDLLSSASFIWITSVVIDTMWTGRMFAYLMTSAQTSWKGRAEPYREDGITYPAACDYLDLKLVAERTRPIVSFSFYPFYILALLILSRFEYFDHWNWRKELIIGYSSLIALVLVAANLLRAEAEKIRSTLIEHLKKGQTFPPEKDSKKYYLINEVDTLKTGAFAPISEQPVMKGIYWIISALGLSGLWQYINQVL